MVSKSKLKGFWPKLKDSLRRSGAERGAGCYQTQLRCHQGSGSCLVSRPTSVC